MKLKQLPEDFQVEELTDITAGNEGPYVLYRLRKQGWSTPDAFQVICNRWQIDWRRISYGGLKDRHAQTVQYFTILHGPERNLTHQRIRVEHLGRVAEPYTSAQIRSNRFQLTLRALDPGRLLHVEAALAEVAREGFPNYFDDQRFGSVSNGQFLAKAMIKEQYQEALQLALMTPYEHDHSSAKREKAILRQHWGDWQKCQKKLAKGQTRRLVEYLLQHPADFQGALERLPARLRSLYLSAYQSHLWNRVLARWLETRCRPEQLLPVPLRLGEVPMHRHLDAPQRAELEALHLPLPTARWKPEPTDPRLPLVREVLAEEGLELGQLRLKWFRKMFFSKGERAALCRPADLAHEADADELHQGKRKLLLRFQLPRGCYATLLVKRVTVFKAPSQI